MFYFLALSLCLSLVMGLTTVRSRLGDNDQRISNISTGDFSQLCVDSYGEMKSAGKARRQSGILDMSETETEVKLIVQMDLLNCSEDQMNFIPNQCTVDKTGHCYCILSVTSQSAEVKYNFCPAFHSHGKVEFPGPVDINYHTTYELAARSCKKFNDNYGLHRIEYGTFGKMVNEKISFNFTVIAVNLTKDMSRMNSQEGSNNMVKLYTYNNVHMSRMNSQEEPRGKLKRSNNIVDEKSYNYSVNAPDMTMYYVSTPHATHEKYACTFGIGVSVWTMAVELVRKMCSFDGYYTEQMLRGKPKEMNVDDPEIQNLTVNALERMQGQKGEKIVAFFVKKATLLITSARYYDIFTEVITISNSSLKFGNKKETCQILVVVHYLEDYTTFYPACSSI